MPGESLVDLLLVRLRGEQDQETVRQMLVDILGMSEEEASASVASTPVLLSKCLPMEEARGIQEKMYPYIDLLPREYGSCDPSEAPTPRQAQAGEAEDVSYVHDPEAGSTLVRQIHGATGVTYGETDPGSEEGAPQDGDETLIITSASEEMLSVDRCHVCGRTPTSDEKLAPCRTCGDLTCSDCFDRIVHVCSKCAAEGMVVDRPIKGQPEFRKRDESEVEEPVVRLAAERRSPNTSMIAILLLAVLAAAFYFLDPLALFGPGEEGVQDAIAGAPIDSLPQDSMGVPVEPLALTPDSSAADSAVLIAADTLPTPPPDSLSLPGEERSLAELTLPEDFEVPAVLVTPVLLLTTPVPGLEALPDSLPIISHNLSCLMSAASIQSEGVALVRTPGGSELLVLSILHPEPVEERSRFIGSLALFLDGSGIDQMVIYYRESPYYEPEILSFVADSFEVIAGVIGPGFIQSRQASLPETWEMVSGPILEWMTQLD